MPSPCLSEHAALDLVEGRLSASERARAHAHLADCSACAALVADLARVLDRTDAEAGTGASSARTPARASWEASTAAAELDELTAPLPRGTEVGPHRVLAPLAAGGMGVVYVAEDPRLGREVALKLLRADVVEAGAAARLRREAQALARVRSPHVVTVHAVGDSPYGVWMAMELVRGHTLAEWLRRGPHPWPEVLGRLRAAARGLRDAHAAGIVHRDFKPSNVLVGDDGRVLVADFGLAATGDAARPAAWDRDDGTAVTTRLTRTGGVVGTPAYMAPEQLAGGTADARADQFSLCVVLHEALYGERPFAGRSVGELRAAIERGRVRRPSDRAVPRWIDRAIERGLAADPARRHRDLDRLLAALDPARPRRRRAAAGASMLGLALAGTVVLAARPTPPTPCADIDARIDAAWGSAQQQAVRAAFLETGVPEAERQLAAVTEQLDARAHAWRQAQAQACAATQSAAADPRLDQRLQCLQTALDETEAAALSLAAAEADTVRRADTIVATLTAIESCDDPSFLDAVLEPPPSPTAAAAIAELRRDVAQARARLATTRDLDAAVAGFRALLERADALGYAPLQLSARLALGRALDLRGESRAAVEQLQPAFFEARRLGDHDAALVAAVQLAQAHGHGLGQLDEALRWTRHAEAAAVALGDRQEQAIAQLVRGELLYDHGRHDEAEPTLLAAWDLLPADAEPRSRASVAETLGNLYASRWEPARALPWLDQALALQEERVGPDHHDLLRGLNARAVCLIQLERWDEATATFERALAIAQAGGSYTAVPAAQLATNLGAAYEHRGDLTAALSHYRQAVAQHEAIHGPTHDETLAVVYNLANVLRKLGRHDEAIASARLGIERAEARDPLAVTALLRVLWVLAESSRARGELQAARDALERRLALRREHHPEDAEAIAEDEAALAELRASSP